MTLAVVPFFLGSEAQILFVNDNDNITYNTDTVLHDLAHTGMAFDTHDIPSLGVPPSATLLSNYSAVVWYCSGDGLDLSFWQPTVQTDLLSHVLAGKTLWVIGADVLYAEYGNAPLTFQAGDLPLDALGIASYDAQSYGDDGNLGCPQVDLATGVAGQFESTLLWSFATHWWVDGCTPATDAEAIYTMGPSSYVLFGSPAMIHYHPPGTNVMSTFFDPALIDTYDHRVQFFQQTIDYLGITAGITAHGGSSNAELVLSPNGSGGAIITCDAPLRDLSIHTAVGQQVFSVRLPRTHRVQVDKSELAAGILLISATTVSGERRSVRWVVQ